MNISTKFLDSTGNILTNTKQEITNHSDGSITILLTFSNNAKIKILLSSDEINIDPINCKFVQKGHIKDGITIVFDAN